MTDNELLLSISNMMDEKLSSTLKAELQPLKDDMKNMNQRMNDMEQRITNIEDDTKDVKQRITNVEGDMKDVKQRITNVEGDMKNVKQRITNVELYIENSIDYNINLLVENYVPAAKRYEKTSAQIETMQIDINLLKKVTADHSAKLQNLS